MYDCGQCQQDQATKESTELTGIAEICRFRIWSSTKNGTKIRSDINDAIIFQVDQLSLSVSEIRPHNATTNELTASSVVLYQPSVRQRQHTITSPREVTHSITT